MTAVTTFLKPGAFITGFSKPYVALYNADDQGNISYTSGRKLARGVQVEIAPNAVERSYASADNGLAEVGGAKIDTGTATVTVDGLLPDSYYFIKGITPTEGTIQDIGDNAANPPEVGLAYIVRYQSGGQVLYRAEFIKRAVYAEGSRNAQTQEYNAAINFQNSALAFNFMTAEDENHSWMGLSGFFTTETEAENIIKTAYGIE